MKIRLSALLVLFLLTQAALAQTFAIKGRMLDRASGEALIGASVQLTKEGTITGAVTDVSGAYKVANLSPGTYAVTATYIGYKTVTENVTVTDRDVVHTFRLGEDNSTLNEVEIVADVAVERETPVAYSTIKESTIRESLAGRDLPMILNETPGVYANGAGGGTGDSEVSIRGFSQNNVAVMVNGVPVNDMENGRVYWSNWDLGDVTKTMQVQRGLSASKLATPSVGGTINILTKGFENKQSIIARQEIGSNNYTKTSFMYSSGLLANDWSFTVFGSRRKGDGWVEGTFDDAYTYFANISKKFGSHTLSLTGLGSPQTHGQRSYHGGLYKIADFSSEKARELGATVLTNPDGTVQGNYGFNYNADYGIIDRFAVNGNDTIHNRQNYNSQQNFYHKPQINLNHFWTLSDKLFISNVVYASIGNGGGSFLAGPVITREGRTDFNAVYRRNYKDKRSSVVERASVNNHYWFGFISGLDYRVSEKTTFSLGVDGRSYKGEHYAEVTDLLGGEYTTPAAANLNGNLNQDRNARLYKGDRFGNIYDGIVKSIGGFAMAEYKTNVISGFLSGTLSQTFYNRINFSQPRLYSIAGNEYPISFQDNVNALISPTNLTSNVNGVYYTPAGLITNGSDTIHLNPNAPVTYRNRQYQQVQGGRTQESEGVSRLGYSLKGGINYNLNEFNNIFFNTGYISRPPFIDFIYSRSTGQLLPGAVNENVLSFEVGYGISRRNFKANLNAYHTTWRNKGTIAPIPRPDGSEGTIQVNISGMNARHVGVELEVAQEISRSLTLNSAISLGDWRWTSSGIARSFDDDGQALGEVKINADGVHVGGSAQNQFMLGLRYEPVKGLFIRPTYLLFAKNYANFDPKDLSGDIPQDSYRLPTSRNIDIHTGYTWNFYKDLKLTLNGSVLNVLNEFYIMNVNPSSTPENPNSLIGFFNRGRTFIIGISVRL